MSRACCIRRGKASSTIRKSRAETLADQITTALSDLGETVSQEEEQIARLIADRPVTSLASAFALGVVVGLLMRRN